MKKKIIFIQSYKFLDFHYDQYEIDKFKKNFKVECHDLTLMKNKKIETHYKYLKNKFEIKKFNNSQEWKKKIFVNLEKYNKNLIICFLHFPSTFFELYIYCLLVKKKSNLYIFDFNNLIKLDFNKNSQLSDRISYKFKRLFTRSRQIINQKKISLINFFSNKFIKYFYPNYIFVNSQDYYLEYKKKFKKTKILRIHSWDASKFISFKKKNFNKKKKIATYLSAFSLKSASDSANYNSLRLENSKKVLESLNHFFAYLEKNQKYSIKIAKHPREENNDNSPIYKSKRRFASKFLTKDLVFNSSIVITTMSSAISYAALFQKPILFVITNEHYKNVSLIKYTKSLAKYFKSDLINIDLIKDYKINKKINDFTKKKYKIFIKDYLISDKFRFKSNNQILTKLFK